MLDDTTGLIQCLNEASNELRVGSSVDILGSVQSDEKQKNYILTKW